MNNINREKYNCDSCSYYTYRLSNWNRHIKSKKHKKKLKYYKCDCGKIYKYMSGFSRHKKECKFIEKNDKLEIINDKLVNLIDNNKKIQKEIIDTQEKYFDRLINNIPNSNTYINNNINYHTFLNINCNKAISIQKFVKNIKFSINDLNNDKNSILTNILLNNLRPLSYTERPVHYININNSVWYIKDEKLGWEKDTGEKLVKNTDIGIQKNWIKLFENEYPNWIQNEYYQDKYIELSSSTTSELSKKQINKVLSNIRKTVNISNNKQISIK
jgi:hypothetical protein